VRLPVFVLYSVPVPVSEEGYLSMPGLYSKIIVKKRENIPGLIS
jgi:hypothetical protein